MIFASFNGGNPVLGLLLLPFFFAGPFVLIWLEVRAFLKSEAQSVLLLLVLLALGILACFYGYGSAKEFQQITGFLKVHLIVAWIGGVAFPFTLAWEVYKQGWLNKWTAAGRKKKKKDRWV